MVYVALRELGVGDRREKSARSAQHMKCQNPTAHQEKRPSHRIAPPTLSAPCWFHAEIKIRGLVTITIGFGHFWSSRMAAPSSDLDEQIERLRKGDTLLENEVKALCDKVSSNAEPDLCAASRHNILPTFCCVCWATTCNVWMSTSTQNRGLNWIDVTLWCVESARGPWPDDIMHCCTANTMNVRSVRHPFLTVFFA